MVKRITIRDEVYRRLLAVKGKDEDFSELFERLAESRAPLETLKRLRAMVEFKENEKEEMLSEMRSKRDGSANLQNSL